MEPVEKNDQTKTQAKNGTDARIYAVNSGLSHSFSREMYKKGTFSIPSLSQLSRYGYKTIIVDAAGLLQNQMNPVLVRYSVLSRWRQIFHPDITKLHPVLV